ncbi:MAG: helix-turn-helix transcriptional regulator [Acidimicrobiales bacterium]
MSTQQLGLEPLIGVEELAEYLGVPVQTIYDWRVAGTAPRAYKFGKRLKFAVSDVRDWLADHQEGHGHA